MLRNKHKKKIITKNTYLSHFLIKKKVTMYLPQIEMTYRQVIEDKYKIQTIFICSLISMIFFFLGLCISYLIIPFKLCNVSIITSPEIKEIASMLFLTHSAQPFRYQMNIAFVHVNYVGFYIQSVNIHVHQLIRFNTFNKL